MVGIETSQHVQLSYEPAGVGERILAYLLDAFFLFVYYLVVVWILGLVSSIEGGGWFDFSSIPNWIPIVFIMLPVMLYHLLCEVLWDGKSIGKWLMGIRVVKVDGTRAGLSSYLLRWLFRFLEITLTSGVVAFVTILLNGKGQRLGDIVGKTCVIKARGRVKLNETLFTEMDSEYEAVFPQAAELEDKEVRVIRQVLDSRKQYDRAAWIEMLNRTRTKIESKTGARNEEMTAEEYLQTIVQDYNRIHGARA